MYIFAAINDSIMKLMSIIKASILALGNLKSVYAGESVPKTEEYKKIKQEVENLRIPTTRDDRENLGNDRQKAVESYRNAFIKRESCNG